MKTYRDKTPENKSQAVATSLPKQQSSDKPTFQFVDNRPEAVAQRQLQSVANDSGQVKQLSAFQSVIQKVGDEKTASGNLWNTIKGLDGAFFGAFHGSVGPLAQGNRSALDSHIRTLPQQPAFTQIVQRLNQSLGVNTEEALPPSKLAEYKRLTTELSEGKIKDSEAMRQSSLGWAKVGHFPATFLNAAGAAAFYLKEGNDAHTARTLGK